MSNNELFTVHQLPHPEVRPSFLMSHNELLAVPQLPHPEGHRRLQPSERFGRGAHNVGHLSTVTRNPGN